MSRDCKVKNHLYEGFTGYIQGVNTRSLKYLVLIYQPKMIGTFELNYNQVELLE